ncbi:MULTISPECIES: hypothetical protein [Ferrimonas]|uniref:Uncharacterized protein n=1 Tax=Ferrimonas sediminum TaxID=718193 RepID=A0A1G8VN03_9GAMM|nr:MULTISPECIES: hypothetical protein [Ferrimonas]USD35864.1 hypothetical protein J8Z22_12500 [Ferrimonas sp. SCSIO 43195]SDJ67441.1 hypothetical protein SAMN04488540_111107 [Ferrimonas sediminum]
MHSSKSNLNTLLHSRFKDAQNIAELRERLRDIEEELHLVFADELAQFVSHNDEHQKVS